MQYETHLGTPLGQNTGGTSYRASGKSNTELYKGKKRFGEKNQLPQCWSGSSYKQHKSTDLQGARIEKKVFAFLIKSLLISIYILHQGKGKFRRNTQKLSLFRNQVSSPKEATSPRTASNEPGQYAPRL